MILDEESYKSRFDSYRLSFCLEKKLHTAEYLTNSLEY